MGTARLTAAASPIALCIKVQNQIIYLKGTFLPFILVNLTIISRKLGLRDILKTAKSLTTVTGQVRNLTT